MLNNGWWGVYRPARLSHSLSFYFSFPTTPSKSVIYVLGIWNEWGSIKTLPNLFHFWLKYVKWRDSWSTTQYKYMLLVELCSHIMGNVDFWCWNFRVFYRFTCVKLKLLDSVFQFAMGIVIFKYLSEIIILMWNLRSS